jgi:hypothetical protein
VDQHHIAGRLGFGGGDKKAKGKYRGGPFYWVPHVIISIMRCLMLVRRSSRKGYLESALRLMTLTIGAGWRWLIDQESGVAHPRLDLVFAEPGRGVQGLAHRGLTHSVLRILSFKDVTITFSSEELASVRIARIAISSADCFFRREAFVLAPLR